MVILSAPESILLSRSSLTTDAGLSITSPAAIWFATFCVSFSDFAHACLSSSSSLSTGNLLSCCRVYEFEISPFLLACLMFILTMGHVKAFLMNLVREMVF
jgi:hypothetical protein